jgi:uncharacterized membrane protein YhhN
VSAALAAATSALVVALLAAEWRGSRAGKWIAKPLASSGFLALAVTRGALATHYGQAIVIALALSWLGDVFLIPRNKTWFRVGLFSFLLGHVAYCAAFVIHGLHGLLAALSAAPLLVLGFVVWRRLGPHVEEKLRPPVQAYIAVITIMVACAIGAQPSQPNPLPLAAAVAFYVSDLSVAMDTFVKRSFWNRLWGLPLYYGAQLLFAWSAGFSRNI